MNCSFSIYRGVQTTPLIKPAFDHPSIRYLAEKEDQIYKNIEHVKHVFVSIDPAAGGQKSKYAVVSCIYKDHKMVVSNCSFSSSKDDYFIEIVIM